MAKKEKMNVLDRKKRKETRNIYMAKKEKMNVLDRKKRNKKYIYGEEREDECARYKEKKKEI